jgi:hypothetical protein
MKKFIPTAVMFAAVAFFASQVIPQEEDFKNLKVLNPANKAEMMRIQRAKRAIPQGAGYANNGERDKCEVFQLQGRATGKLRFLPRRKPQTKSRDKEVIIFLF